ncbi:class I SAM-dependent methyltransferase [Parasedimentitalea maritima]|uniref:Class I SAM-dependent methyltransferase n=1 Tax=Parasedimentitalea maritima TaxID=2578117 RepID=A0A6A4RL68_9RHOB|nr:SAM-dependent methyltransferase [Zongyanglinia marina]KAE9630534.1 class I SAM-dependent methyltransferase [Zongyanglinia marina]
MSLRDHLIARIDADGPMSVADYMNECLLNPKYGYYTTRDPLGAAGDFITAPEISQMFGELLGLSLAQSWLDQGSPAPFTLAELGPGRGTLMADLLRATKSVPGFHAAAQIVLVEASPTLQAAQQQALAGYSVQWEDTVSSLADTPLWLVANEFFDALPIRQFLRDGDGWREKRVGLQQGQLAFGLGPSTPQPALDHRQHDTQDGDLVEICEAAAPILATVAQRISKHGGAALIVDYGDWRALGDTLQALRSHKSTDTLDDPGQADLTAHVDFEALAQVAQTAGCAYSRVTPQGVFLERLGITTRAQTLAKQLNGPALDNLIAAHQRLTHPEEMGNLFKVLGLYPDQTTPPPGLNA